MNKLFMEKSVKLINTYQTMFISMCMIIGGVILLLISQKFCEPFNAIFRSIAEVVLITGGIGALYDRFLRIRFQNEMAVVVNRAVNADVIFLKEKMKGEVDSIIRNCLEAKLCNEGRATALYDSLGFPYLDKEIFRDNFDYEIWLKELEKEEIKIDTIIFNKEVYFRTREELKYSKRLRLEKKQRLIVGICFKDEQLDAYRRKECIYRTILRIGDDERSLLENLLKISPEKIYENDFFKINVRVNESALECPKIDAYNEGKGIEIVYEYNGESNERTEYEIIITSIRNKKINYYTAYLYDPTRNPKIKFNYCKEIKDVSPIAYLTSKSRGSKKKIRPDPPDPYAGYISVEIDEWVFPTSGAVFIWKVCNWEG